MSKKREQVWSLFLREQEAKNQIAKWSEALKQIQAELDRLLPDEEEPSEKPRGTVIVPRVPKIGNLTEAILRTLADWPTPLSPVDVSEKLNAHERIDSIRSTLTRLFDEGRVERPEPGKYIAKKPSQSGSNANGKGFSGGVASAGNPERKDTA